MLFYKILRLTLLIVSCGFYTLHISSAECPGHPRSPEEIQDEDDENNPANKYERKKLDEIDPDNAPHSEEDRKNWASRN